MTHILFLEPTRYGLGDCRHTSELENYFSEKGMLKYYEKKRTNKCKRQLEKRISDLRMSLGYQCTSDTFYLLYEVQARITPTLMIGNKKRNRKKTLRLLQMKSFVVI